MNAQNGRITMPPAVPVVPQPAAIVQVVLLQDGQLNVQGQVKDLKQMLQMLAVATQQIAAKLPDAPAPVITVAPADFLGRQ